MTQQSMPFFESDKAATKYAIQASGKSMKDVGHALWPNKTMERAQTDLLSALNENRAEQLSTDEHIFIAVYVGQFEWLHYACHRAMHSRPSPVSPSEQAAELQQALFDTAGQMRALLDRVDALKPRLRAAA